MDNFVRWYQEYWNEITWWVIGWLTFAVVDNIIREQWIWAVVNTVLIFVNYFMWKNKDA